MAEFSETVTSVTERRFFYWLLLGYCFVVLYGSFIPFRFSSNAAFIGSQWERFLLPRYIQGLRHYSVLDIISNVLLFVPFGFLWVSCGREGRGAPRWSRVVLVTAGVGSLYGLGIELGQLFSPGRTPSLMDAICNGGGAAIGGAAAHILVRSLRGQAGTLLLQVIRQRPSLIVLTLLLLVALADTFYPFHVTLDVSTAWENLKRVQWVPFSPRLHIFWLDLLIPRVVVFAAVSLLIQRNCLQTSLTQRFAVIVFSILFPLFLESGKLFFVGRVPRVENVIVGAAGGVCGIFLVPAIINMSPIKRRPIGFLTLLSLTLLIHSELSPYNWIQSVHEIPHQFARIEWLPLVAYYKADPQLAVFDLGKKLFLMGPLGFLLAVKSGQKGPRSRWQVVMIAVLTGTALEACQIALHTRIPSITDVLTFGIAAWIGASVQERYRAILTLGAF